jgi:hypothetical protein
MRELASISAIRHIRLALSAKNNVFGVIDSVLDNSRVVVHLGCCLVIYSQEHIFKLASP